MKKKGVRKAIKINLWLAKEELTAMTGMMAVAIITLALFGQSLLLDIVSVICAGMGLYFMNKAICKIFVENRYGDSSRLVMMLPIEDKSLRKGNYIVAAGAVSGMVFALALCLLAGYLALHRYDLENVMGFIRWLCCGGSSDIAGESAWALFTFEVIYIIALGLCVAACAEYTAEAAKGKGSSGFALPPDLFMVGILLPRLVLLASASIPPLPFHLIKITVATALAVLFYQLAAKAGDGSAQSKEKEKNRSELDLRDISDKRKAYERLIDSKGRIWNWKQMLILALPVCIILRNVEVSGAIILLLVIVGFCLLGETIREWNTSILFDENAAFYYSLPIKTEEIVKTHMKIGFKRMIPIPLIAIVMLLIWHAQKGFSLGAGLVLWVLTICVLAFAFSGWGLFNGAFASRWRDPLTHKTSRFAGGICLLVEVAIHWAIVMLVLYADGIGRTIGSIFLLLAALAECYLVYRLGISELRDMYSA